MLPGIFICFGYVLLLLGVARLSGVKYVDILDNTDNIKNGLLIPVGLCGGLLVLLTWYFGWLGVAFTESNKLDATWLSIVPVAMIIGIISRLGRAHKNTFSRGAKFYLLLSVIFVGVSEELLTRGVLVELLERAGYPLLFVAITSSLVFGLMHGVNFLNGQSARLTVVQMIFSTFFGLGMFVVLRLTGSLWIPIILHAGYNFSLLLQGGKLNHTKVKSQPVELLATIVMYAGAVASLFFM